MSGTVIATERPVTVITEAETNCPAVPAKTPSETTVDFNLTAEVAIDSGTVNFEPNATVMIPPTGIAVIPAPPSATPVTVIVY
jgi:hypothetical protein